MPRSMARRPPCIAPTSRPSASSCPPARRKWRSRSPRPHTGRGSSSPCSRRCSRSACWLRPSGGAGAPTMLERALVVIPTYNERVNLPVIVPQVLEQDARLEVLVVDDNSPDGTGRLADELAEGNPRVHVLHRPNKEGLGRAYLAGFRWALACDFDLVLEMDADRSHDPKY